MNQQQPEAKKSPNWTIYLFSPLLLAALLFSLLNLGMVFTQPLAQVDPESLPSAHTWIWWATREYQNQKPPPKVVLLGSSLVMHPVSRQDADFLGKDLDYVHHHRSQYMQQLLKDKLGASNAACFNFALPGGMMSDDYMVARALFNKENKPSLLVLGLSLRDFIDNGVRCAGATPAFRYLKRYTDISDLVDISMPQIWQRFDYWVGQGVYLWGKKLDLQVMLSQQARQTLGPWVERYCQPSRLNELDLSRNLPSNLKAEVEENMFIVKSHQPYSYEDNSAEYRKRYRSPNKPLFAIQKVFLDKTLDLCRKQNIEVLVVNMPLTPQNMSLMPQGSYDTYLSDLKSTCHRRQCSFLDLNTSAYYNHKHFYDTSHMNAEGGKQLIDTLVSTITQETRMAQSLQPAAKDAPIRALAKTGGQL